MKKVFALILAVGMGFFVQAADKAADDLAVRRELAEQVLKSIGLEEQISASFESVKKIQRQIIDKTLENSRKGKEVEDFRKEVLKISDDALSWDKVKDEFVNAYAEKYSVKELRGMLKFFLSEPGKAFLTKNPELQRKLLPILQQRLKDSTSKIRKMTHEFMKAQMLQGKTVMPENLKAKAEKKK